MRIATIKDESAKNFVEAPALGLVRERKIVEYLRAERWAIETSEVLDHDKKIDFVVRAIRRGFPLPMLVEVQMTFTNFNRGKLFEFTSKQAVRGGREIRLYQEIGRETRNARHASNEFIRRGLEENILRLISAAPGSVWAARMGFPCGELMPALEYLRKLDRFSDLWKSRRHRMGGWIVRWAGDNGFVVDSTGGFEFLGYFYDIVSPRFRERLMARKLAGDELSDSPRRGGYISFVPCAPWNPCLSRATLIRAARSGYPANPREVQAVD